MADLKEAFESMGFTQVVTVLQSGNVIFDAADSSIEVLKSRIETGMTEVFHYPAKTQIVSIDQLQRIIADCPFMEADPDVHRYVLFFEHHLEIELVDQARAIDPSIEVVPGNGVAYWRCPKGQTLDNPLGKLLEKPQFRQFHTNRNLNTLEKIVDQ